MKKIIKLMAILLSYMLIISFVPNDVAKAAEKTKQKKNKNIETGYIYNMMQYEDNFVMEYNSPVEGYRIVNKNGKTFGLYEENYYNSEPFSRYAYTSEAEIIDLKDFSKMDKKDEIIKVKKELENKYKDYDFQITLEKIINEKYIYDVYGRKLNGDGEIIGTYYNGKVYDQEKLNYYEYIIVGNKIISLKNESRNNTKLWYLYIVDENTEKIERVNLFETEDYETYEIDYIGDKIIIRNSNEIMRYKIENNKIIKIDNTNGRNLTTDKNGDIWTVNGKNIIKYENGNKTIKKVLDKEYTNIFVYDENRIVVDNENDYSIKVLYSDINKGEWKLMDGNYYYYENGVIQKGWKFIDGYYYYLNEDGTMQIGWLNINGFWYYLDLSGRMAELIQEIDGKLYYFDKKTGIMQNNGWVIAEGSGEYVYCQENGELFKGWLYLNDEYYYLDEYGFMITGIIEIDNNKYYFDHSGIMQTGWKLIEEYNSSIDQWVEGYIYFSPSGEMKTGWQWINGEYYYLKEENGIMQTGWYFDGANWYFLNDSGKMQTGWCFDGSNWYFLNDSGKMQTGWYFDGANWYLLNDSGKMQTGWYFDGANWYLLNNSGKMQIGWHFNGIKWYLLNSSGKMQIGWQWIDNNWYYLYSSGEMATNTTIDGWNIGYNGVAKKVI